MDVSDDDAPLLTSAWEHVTAEEWPESDDPDYYDEEEVAYITLDFAQASSSLNAPQAFKRFQILELESATPFFSVGSMVFQGQHERLIGDEIILAPVEPVPTKGRAPTQDALPTYEHFATTSHRIVFQQVLLQPHQTEAEASSRKKAKTAPRQARSMSAGAEKKKLAGSRPARMRKIAELEVDETIDANVQAKGNAVLRRVAPSAKTLPGKRGRRKGDTMAADPTNANAEAGPSNSTR